MSIDRSSIDQAIVERFEVDPGFRAALMSDPRAALSDLVGRAIPENVSISVHEETPTDIHLVIPAGAMLSETDLELVAGGTGSWSSNCDSWPS